MKSICRLSALLAITMAGSLIAKPAAKYERVASIDVAKVVSDFRVGFDMITTSSHQYLAYYDAERRMTVSSRSLDSDTWIHQTLPSKVGWDSHNYITMALDSEGQLHVSGNLHADPLIYFRTEKRGDITSLKPAAMTGKLEDRTTYPKFFTDLQGRLVFTYRHGGSGNGVNIYNRYDTATRTWSRLLDTPLFDGEGLRSAYPAGPTLGPDGLFHIHWVWRDTPDCSTNQHLSYARSRDLIHWESAFGRQIQLPIRFDHRELLVDPIPPGGGMINGGHHIAFDAANQPMLAYHKADPMGNMQLYVARPGRESWENHVLTAWKAPVHFSGNGSMPFIGIAITRFGEISPGILGVGYSHRDHGGGMLQLDAKSLRPVERKISLPPDYPPELTRAASRFPGMQVRLTTSPDESAGDDFMHVLQWESLGANRDQAPSPPLPEPSMLRVHKLKRAASH